MNKTATIHESGSSRVIRRGDIYFLRKPVATVGHEQSGERPVIIVSNDTGNACSGIVQAVPLTTSQKHRNLPVNVPIDEMERPSVALCNQLITVDKHRLGRCVGHAGNSTMRKISRAIMVSMSLFEYAA